MEYAVKTLQQAIQHFGDPENCRKFMEFMRWPDGVIACPHCGATKLTWLAKEKAYFCYGDHKRKKFSLKVGTMMEDSPIGLDKWLPAFWLLCNCKNGISSYELAKDLGVTQKDRMVHAASDSHFDEGHWRSIRLTATADPSKSMRLSSAASTTTCTDRAGWA